MTWLHRFGAFLIVVLVFVAPHMSWASTMSKQEKISTQLITSVQLPLDHAETLAHEALLACRRHEAAVSVTVVDPNGKAQVTLRDDHAAPHSLELSHQKAYTAVSMAALQQLHTTSELMKGLSRQTISVGDLAMPSAPIAGITPLPGGVVVTWKGQLLAGLGVSGARQGKIDEICALEAEATLRRRLEQPATY